MLSPIIFIRGKWNASSSDAREFGLRDACERPGPIMHGNVMLRSDRKLNRHAIHRLHRLGQKAEFEWFFRKKREASNRQACAKG